LRRAVLLVAVLFVPALRVRDALALVAAVRRRRGRSSRATASNCVAI
jgi:hypothetical protein